MTADLEKNVVFGHFTLLQILQPNEWIITFEVSWCHIMMISCHFKGFWKFQKNWSFRWPRTWRKMWFLDILHFCRFCSQMSELLHLRCPDVILWWFPAILRAFEKFKKIEVFDDRGPGEKCRFWTFHTFADFAAKWVNYYILGNEWIITFEVSWCHIMMISCHFKGFWKFQKNWSFRWPRTWRKMWFLDILHFCRFCSQMSELLHLRCPDVILWWFPAILRAFEKFKKIEVFDDRGPGEKCRFWTFHTFADFAAKWVNNYIWGVLMSYYDDFLPF